MWRYRPSFRLRRSVGLSRKAVSASSTGSCGTCAIFDHAGSVTPILPPNTSIALHPHIPHLWNSARKLSLHLTMPNIARFEASAAASLRSSLFWNVTQTSFMTGYRSFGTACQSSLLRSSSKRRVWAFKMAPTSCPEKVYSRLPTYDA